MLPPTTSASSSSSSSSSYATPTTTVTPPAPPPPDPTTGHQYGDRSKHVVTLQNRLVKTGNMTQAQMDTGPGVFGPRTRAAVSSFQDANNLKVTGKVNAATAKALVAAVKPKPKQPTPGTPNSAAYGAPNAVMDSGGIPPKGTTVSTPTGATPLTEPTANMTTKQQYAQLQAIVKSQGGNFQTGPMQFNLIGYRKSDNTHANGGQGVYDDKLFVAWKDTNGREHVQPYQYNTEPCSAFAYDSSDVNGDGTPDQGRIPQGNYTYAVSSRSDGRPCLRSTSDFKTQRDLNHDGVIDGKATYGGGATMLFHEGGENGTYSAGCQTFKPEEWYPFWNTVSKAKGNLSYTLINKS